MKDQKLTKNSIEGLLGLMKYKRDEKFLEFKANYFMWAIITFPVLFCLSSSAWIFRDIFAMARTPQTIIPMTILRASGLIFLPFLFYYIKNRLTDSWSFSLILVWINIITVLFAKYAFPPTGVNTGDGWIAYYFSFFVCSLFASRQWPIYLSYVLFTFLILVTDSSICSLGYIHYTSPLYRPLSTTLLMSAGYIMLSIAIRSMLCLFYVSQSKLENVSKKDLLSDCWNRHIIDDITEDGNFKSEKTLFILDIDNFKQINDECGHLVGDEYIKETVKYLKAISRDSDAVIRYGGDEFVIIFDGLIDEDTVYCRLSSELKKNNSPLTFSVGSCKVFLKDLSFHNAIKRADTAMYYSKNTGKNKHTKYTEKLLNP